MQLSANLRARISALGELSRPLGEARAATFARELATDVAQDVARGQNPEKTIDAWIRRLANEIVAQAPKQAGEAPRARSAPRRLADILPEVR